MNQLKNKDKHTYGHKLDLAIVFENNSAIDDLTDNSNT